MVSSRNAGRSTPCRENWCLTDCTAGGRMPARRQLDRKCSPVQRLDVRQVAQPTMSRDDFSRRVLDTLSQRVGLRCSNPKCSAPTAGPRTESSASVNIGVGAHITAASPGGPRYDAKLTPSERKSIENGVWLCQSCGKLVDNDPSCYTAQVLRQWKRQAEDAARSALEQGSSPETLEERTELCAYRRQLIASWRDAIEAEKYEYIDYRSAFRLPLPIQACGSIFYLRS